MITYDGNEENFYAIIIKIYYFPVKIYCFPEEDEIWKMNFMEMK